MLSTTSLPPLLKVSGVHKTFGGVHALRGVSFELRAGEVHALVGENGAGKSTFIKVLTGAHRPDAGSVEFDGRDVTGLDPRAARSMGIAAIYQQPALFPDLSVAENLAVRLERGGPWRLISWRGRKRHAAELLGRLGVTGIDPAAPVRDLSMPQQQLVEIAAAVGSDARVLILDEPTASLGQRDADHLFRVIADLRGRGVGMIYISHRLEELPRVADRVTVFRDGAYVSTHPMSEVDPPRLIRLMVGREVSAVFPKVEHTPGDVVLETRGLRCVAAGVYDVSLQVRAGEILGLAGLTGAGRTELAGVLFGLTPADAGQILLRGRPVSVPSPTHAVDLGIAYVPEDRRRHGVILDMSVAANTSLAVLNQLSPRGLIDFQRERALSSDYVRRLGTKTPTVDTLVGNLSGGNQQKVSLSKWLATDPAVVLLDEPTQGVDIGAKAEIHRQIGELARRGLAVILISSELMELLGMSDRIAVMRAGRIAGTLDRGQATQEAVLALALGQAGKGAAA